MKKSFWISIFILFASTLIFASQVELKDGRVIQGDIAQIDSVTTGSGEDISSRVQSILIIDDRLRQIFVSKQQVVDVIASEPAEALETFKIPQQTPKMARRVGGFFGYQVAEDFDEHGRRIVVVEGTPYIQGITEINPRYVRMLGQNITWDMRMATSNLSREAISKILMQQINPRNIEDRKRIVRFFIQAERDRNAKEELDAILKDFAGEENMIRDLSGVKNAIVQSEARTMLRELELRRATGQFELVKTLLKNFPSENVSGEIMQKVRGMIRQDDELEQRRITVLAKLRPMIDAIPDEKNRELAEDIFREIEAELDANTMDRMTTFFASLNDPNRNDEEKLAFALSGWFVGGLNATPSLPMAVSMQTIRDLVVQYLIKKDASYRDEIFKKIQAQEAGTPEWVAQILPILKPPYPLNVEPAPERPGYYTLETPSYAEGLPPFQYCVQLPPEYNPNRRYPMIVTLHGDTTPDQQIDWWAGPWKDQQRAGQASRQGYIVIAPSWNPENVFPYDFSAGAQATVLYCYYDALRHFSVDTDRVYLTGHSLGGTAAWDIGLSHPDLWAGIIPISAFGGKDSYLKMMMQNARYVPTYFIGGELDAGNWLASNQPYFDWYLQHGLPTTVVQFLGRGRESFSDEILRLFDWMKLCKREYPRKSFEVSTMRPWDNAFWWVEVEGFSEKNMVDPMDWPVKGVRPAKIEATQTQNNGLRVSTSQAQRVFLWLSPELINFDLKTEITINGKKVPLTGGFAEPDLRQMLDDVRTRHDRNHPYWARVDLILYK